MESILWIDVLYVYCVCCDLFAFLQTNTELFHRCKFTCTLFDSVFIHCGFNDYFNECKLRFHPFCRRFKFVAKQPVLSSLQTLNLNFDLSKCLERFTKKRIKLKQTTKDR